MEICGKREMELLEKIGFTRIAGSPEEEKAAQILKAECDAIGVPAIIEPFEIEQGIVEEATLEILEPFQQEYPVTGYQCAENTPRGPHRGVCLCGERHRRGFAGRPGEDCAGQRLYAGAPV